MVKRICQVCGKEFMVHKSLVKKGGGKFCSNECYWKSIRKRVKKVCEVCGKRFEVSISEKDRRFCSKECYLRYAVKRVKKICEVCGKEFEVPLSDGDRRFCSKECCDEYRRSREYRSRVSKKQSEVMKVLWEDPEFKKKMSEARKMLWRDPEFKKKMSEVRKMMWRDPELRKKQSEKIKVLWKDPEYRERIVKGIVAKTELKPNGLEKAFCDLLQSYFPGEWRYVGDGKVFIVGFVPDFIHKEENWIIELNGDYWHSFPEAMEKDRRKREVYDRCGYRVLEVWESEFKSDPMAVVDKIVETFYCLN